LILVSFGVHYGYVIGNSTFYSSPEKDPYNSGPPACLHRRPPNAMAATLFKRELFVAHKSMKCYQMIHICLPRTNKCSYAVVGDWGPVHADIDLYETLAKKLGHTGYEKAEWTIVSYNQWAFDSLRKKRFNAKKVGTNKTRIGGLLPKAKRNCGKRKAQVKTSKSKKIAG